MTSMFDQFEQAAMNTKSTNLNPAEMNNLGFINMSLGQDVPIFSKTKKDFKPSDRITHVAIANKNLVILQANGILFRMNLHNPNQCIEVPLTKYTTNYRITNLFLDPAGNHLLIALVPKTPDGLPDMIYIPKKSDKVKATTKFKGNELTEVAWNIFNESESTTGPVLLGKDIHNLDLLF